MEALPNEETIPKITHIKLEPRLSNTGYSCGFYIYGKNLQNIEAIALQDIFDKKVLAKANFPNQNEIEYLLELEPENTFKQVRRFFNRKLVLYAKSGAQVSREISEDDIMPPQEVIEGQSTARIPIKTLIDSAFLFCLMSLKVGDSGGRDGYDDFVFLQSHKSDVKMILDFLDNILFKVSLDVCLWNIDKILLNENLGVKDKTTILEHIKKSLEGFTNKNQELFGISAENYRKLWQSGVLLEFCQVKKDKMVFDHDWKIYEKPKCEVKYFLHGFHVLMKKAKDMIKYARLNVIDAIQEMWKLSIIPRTFLELYFCGNEIFRGQKIDGYLGKLKFCAEMSKISVLYEPFVLETLLDEALPNLEIANQIDRKWVSDVNNQFQEITRLRYIIGNLKNTTGILHGNFDGTSVTISEIWPDFHCPEKITLFPSLNFYPKENFILVNLPQISDGNRAMEDLIRAGIPFLKNLVVISKLDNVSNVIIDLVYSALRGHQDVLFCFDIAGIYSFDVVEKFENATEFLKSKLTENAKSMNVFDPFMNFLEIVPVYFGERPEDLATWGILEDAQFVRGWVEERTTSWPIQEKPKTEKVVNKVQEIKGTQLLPQQENETLKIGTERKRKLDENRIENEDEMEDIKLDEEAYEKHSEKKRKTDVAIQSPTAANCFKAKKFKLKKPKINPFMKNRFKKKKNNSNSTS
jgi:hypothetical protein